MSKSEGTGSPVRVHHLFAFLLFLNSVRAQLPIETWGTFGNPQSCSHFMKLTGARSWPRSCTAIRNWEQIATNLLLHHATCMHPKVDGSAHDSLCSEQHMCALAKAQPRLSCL